MTNSLFLTNRELGVLGREADEKILMMVTGYPKSIRTRPASPSPCISQESLDRVTGAPSRRSTTDWILAYQSALISPRLLSRLASSTCVTL